MDDIDITWADREHTRYHAVAIQVADLVVDKQMAYGDSFSLAPKILAVLYPNGVAPSQLSEMLTIVRIIDKISRIATDNDPSGESPYRDIIGYCLLAVARRESR